MSLENEGKKYDVIASGFAELRDSFNTEKKYLDMFLKYFQSKAHILDIGCGSGYPIASYLIDQRLQVTGVDASAELLKIAQLKCPAMNRICADIRTVSLKDKYDGIIEWWCLFHLPKTDHGKMISRFANWLKPGGILEFTSGDREYEEKSSDMLNQELNFYSIEPKQYEKYLRENGFTVLSCESDQEQHLVWIAKKDF